MTRVLANAASAFVLLAAPLATAQTAPSAAAPPPPLAPSAKSAFDFVPPPPPQASTSRTLESIRAAGRLDCAVVAPQEDWTAEDIHGDLSPFETEICRGLAAALLGDPAKATIHVYPGEFEAVIALRGGQVQVAVGLSPSTNLAVTHGITYGRPVYFDSVRLLTHKDSGIHAAADLKDHLICAMDLSYAEMTVQDEMAARGVHITVQSHSEQGENDAAVAVRHCAAGAGTETRLAQSRGRFHAYTPNFVFLPERWGLAPMVVATRWGDALWSLAVDDVIDALVEAESIGVTQANAGQAASRDDIGAGLLTGQDVAIPRALGVPRDWAVRAVVAVGNYGEIFDRTIGQPYRLDRGFNAPWNAGGLMAPNPLR